MFFKNFRLTRSDFKLLKDKKGFYLNSPLISLTFYNIPDLFKYQKVAFTCSKKVSLSAVKRNKLRRQGFYVLRGLISNIKKGSVLHFFYKKDSNKASFDEIKKEIENLIRLSKVLN